jgi:uncharacterized protein (DUF1778 family)
MRTTHRTWRILYCTAALLFAAYVIRPATGERYLRNRGALISKESWAGFVISTDIIWASNAVTDHELSHLKFAQHLHRLDLTDNPQITDNGLDRIRAICPELTVLDLIGTSVTESSVRRFESRVPECSVHWHKPKNRKGKKSSGVSVQSTPRADAR